MTTGFALFLYKGLLKNGLILACECPFVYLQTLTKASVFTRLFQPTFSLNSKFWGLFGICLYFGLITTFSVANGPSDAQC